MDGATSAIKTFRLVGSATIQDEANKLSATITFVENPKKAGIISGITGLWGSSPKPKTPEEIQAEFNRIQVEISKDGKKVASGSGHYTSYFEIDGKVYWRFDDEGLLFDHTDASLEHPFTKETVELKQSILEKKYEVANE